MTLYDWERFDSDVGEVRHLPYVTGPFNACWHHQLCVLQKGHEGPCFESHRTELLAKKQAPGSQDPRQRTKPKVSRTGIGFYGDVPCLEDMPPDAFNDAVPLVLNDELTAAYCEVCGHVQWNTQKTKTFFCSNPVHKGLMVKRVNMLFFRDKERRDIADETLIAYAEIQIARRLGERRALAALKGSSAPAAQLLVSAQTNGAVPDTTPKPEPEPAPKPKENDWEAWSSATWDSD